MENKNTNLPVIVKDVSDSVMARVNDMLEHKELVLPEGYNAGTALRSAALILQETKDKNGMTALEVCTKASVCNALLDMCIQGLQPSKKQCYFIAYGNQLQMFRSYFGTQAALKNAMPEVGKVVADLVHQDDEVVWQTNEYGERYVEKIVTDPITNINKAIVFGYCNIYNTKGEIIGTTVMTWDDIQKSWRQSRNFKADGIHQKFPSEMAKRTLINRACKGLLNTSVDTDRNAIIEAFNRTTDGEFDNDPKKAEESKDEPVAQTMADRVKAKYMAQKKEEEKPVEIEPVIKPETEDDFPFEPTNESNSEGLF